MSALADERDELKAGVEQLRDERDRALDLLGRLVDWADDGMAGVPTADFEALRAAYALVGRPEQEGLR